MLDLLSNFAEKVSSLVQAASLCVGEGRGFMDKRGEGHYSRCVGLRTTFFEFLRMSSCEGRRLCSRRSLMDKDPLHLQMWFLSMVFCVGQTGRAGRSPECVCVCVCVTGNFLSANCRGKCLQNCQSLEKSMQNC